MRCPRCGREGKPAVKKVRSKGREYWYRVVRHPDGSVCIVERLSERGEGVAAGERGYELIAAATRIIELYSSGFARARAGRPALFCPLWPACHQSGGPTGALSSSPPETQRRVSGSAPELHL